MKQAAGRATRSERLAGEGRGEVVRGRVRRKLGEVQEDFE
jgi:uncharacterized protein YjbJ (UPF0337 family)